jgi:hypothetical protein
MSAIYFPDTEYAKLVSAGLTIPTLLNIAPCPMSGRVTENEVKIALGEDWNIWPASICDGSREVAL